MNEKIFSPVFFDLSVRNLRLNFLRSLLAMIGIIIGVVAITSMGMTGAAFSEELTGSLTGTSNSITVSGIASTGSGPNSYTASGLSTKDLRNIESAIESVTENYVLIPMYTGYDMVRPAGSEEQMQASIYGLSSADIESLVTVEEGKVPTGNNGVIIGRQLADDYDLSVGSRIEIPQRNSTTISVRVVGIMANSGSMTFTFSGIMANSGSMTFTFSTDNAIIGTTDWYERFHETGGLYTSAMITVDDLNDLDPVIAAIEEKMNGRADRTTDDTVMISDARQFVESMQESIGMISVFIMALGGISLVVAAVSIFNVMLMSVNERIREIGILRSIGTLRSQIIQMFLYEAAVIGFIGAVIGGILSLIAAALVISLMLGDISLMFNLSVLMYIPYGIVIGVFVCLLSGLYPAWKAANLNPVEALASD